MTLSPPAGFVGTFLTDADRAAAYSTASGPYRHDPAAVAVPADVADVQRLVEWAREDRTALIPRGAGTGMPGGNVGPFVVMDLVTGFRRADPVNPESRTVRVEAGVTAAEVQRAAQRHGLDFPPLPSSARWATVGGMIAAGAAGARSFGLGAVGDWVESVEVVLFSGAEASFARGTGTGTGSAAEPGPSTPLAAAPLAAAAREGAAEWPAVRKNSSGYRLDRFHASGDWLDIMVASEGTLCAVTGATLRLRARPPHRTLIVAGAANRECVSDWADAARALGAVACEFIGPWLVLHAGLADDPRVGPILPGGGSAVLLEIEGDADEVDRALEQVRAAARDLSPGGILEEPSEGSTLWSLRKRASPTIEAASARGLRSMQFIEDSVVPPNRLGEYWRGVERILSRADTEAALFGHAGDANVHVNPLIDVTRSGWLDRVRGILDDTVDLVAGLGGTLAGEHGDGRVRSPYVDRIWSAAQRHAFRQVKQAFDPDGIGNPGVILPLPDQDPLQGISAGPSIRLPGH